MENHGDVIDGQCHDANWDGEPILVILHYLNYPVANQAACIFFFST